MIAADSPPSPPPNAPAADGACLPEGYRINEYLIERPLGGGGFGITYLARDGNLDLPVAIKEYFPSDLVTRSPDQGVHVRATQGSGNQETYDWGLERFLDEARALATFRHPNIVRVLRYFRENGTAYIVMEYESGQSLKRWLPQNSPLSQRALLSILHPLLDGLEAVHRTGFLHRDIKPDNIYVRGDGTPVLLDFGAARRVSANKEMTNIVSPGFAPFEQYHSQGNQGPWTDIYSIGAVMYWMTTGKKPMESAARVKSDIMLPAAGLAEASVFGATLLHAIDWAMHPDESRRPQTVALFRAAILGTEKIEGVRVDFDLDLDSPAASTTGQAASQTPNLSRPGAFASATRRNLLGTIMFLDLVGHSKRSVDDQVALKKMFNDLVGKSLNGVPEESRLAIDTGDGAAICFMGDPEEALNSAMLLRDLLQTRKALAVRIGLHMGPVRVVSDINQRVNVVGDGINVAQRIMDFAQANQVLVSRSYYDVISRITDDSADLFQYLGQSEDKHGRLHELFAVASHRPPGTTQREGPSTGYTETLPVKPYQPLSAEDVHDIEVELARQIGPLAKVLVRKAVTRSASLNGLREALAPSIQEAKAREAFLSASASQSQPVSRPRSGASNPPFSSSRSPGSQFGATGPGSLSVPMGSRPAQSVPMGTRPAPAVQFELAADEMALVEQTLSKYIGPMAKMLVRRQLGRSASYQDFVGAIAANIDQPKEREAFLQALKRVLPRRSN